MGSASTWNFVAFFRKKKNSKPLVHNAYLQLSISSKNGLTSSMSLCRLFVVAHLDRAPLGLLRFWAADHDTLDVLRHMTLASAEYRHVCATTSASHENEEVRRHVLYRDPVFVKERAGYALAHQLLGLSP